MSRWLIAGLLGVYVAAALKPAPAQGPVEGGDVAYRTDAIYVKEEVIDLAFFPDDLAIVIAGQRSISIFRIEPASLVQEIFLDFDLQAVDVNGAGSIVVVGSTLLGQRGSATQAMIAMLAPLDERDLASGYRETFRGVFSDIARFTDVDVTASGQIFVASASHNAVPILPQDGTVAGCEIDSGCLVFNPQIPAMPLHCFPGNQLSVHEVSRERTVYATWNTASGSIEIGEYGRNEELPRAVCLQQFRGSLREVDLEEVFGGEPTSANSVRVVGFETEIGTEPSVGFLVWDLSSNTFVLVAQPVEGAFPSPRVYDVEEIQGKGDEVSPGVSKLVSDREGAAVLAYDGRDGRLLWLRVDGGEGSMELGGMIDGLGNVSDIDIRDDGKFVAISLEQGIEDVTSEIVILREFEEVFAAGRIPNARPSIAWLQGALLERGYDAGRVDGIWGRRTAAALERFQTENGIEPHGGFTAQTLERLRGRGRGSVFRDHLEDGSDCPYCPDMVVLPEGEFMMGSTEAERQWAVNQGSRQEWVDREKPQHRVAIAEPFAVGKYEVTFDEWNACVEGGGCNAYEPDDEAWGRERRPVINVNWYDAQAYVRWLGAQTDREYRLLTEAEWEYAARGQTDTAYWWGARVGRGNANCDGCGSQWDGEMTAPVGQFAPNPFGLYDTVGNVREWVEDCWQDRYNDNAPNDGSAWTSGKCDWRVNRDGSWSHGPELARSAARDPARQPDERTPRRGFRVARDLMPSELAR